MSIAFSFPSHTTIAHNLRYILGSCRSTKQLRQVHAQILKLDHEIDHLLSFYAHSQFPNLSYAKTLFFNLSRPSVFHCNSLIRGLAAAKALADESISIYRSMLLAGTRPNNFTFPFLIKACCSSSSTSTHHCPCTTRGSMLHAHILGVGMDSDPYIQCGLIHMYAAVGKDFDSARKVFEFCSAKQTVCWNSMIDGFVKCGEIELARSVFDRMTCKDVVSWNTMINGYSVLGDLKEACQLFDGMPQRNLVSWNSILAGYAKCGDVVGARKLFREMPHRDVVSWNTMLACYTQGMRCEEALVLFDEMQGACIKPTDATLVSMLSVCAHLGALDRGERLHGLIEECNIVLNTILATALVDMYAKCGKISRAYEVFCDIEYKDVLAWNAIVAGVAVHGQATEALRLLSQMMDDGSKPDDMTFVAVLSACGHAGLVREGRQLLECMKGTYGVEPKVEHYGCVIDLLARKGLLEDAATLMDSMPMEPNAPAWGALLGGCRIHGNSKVADGVGERILSLQPNHSGRYVILSNIYASTSRWEDARKVRTMMATRGIKKVPGMSMIELNGVLNQFVAGDQSHPESKYIYQKLLEVSERLKLEAGYYPDIKHALVDIEEEEKEYMLLVHSEKLAIAFGLLHTSLGESIRIIKNIRVCGDCHHLMKFISKVYCREIVMRDRNRFHIFTDGTCSCRDYW